MGCLPHCSGGPLCLNLVLLLGMFVERLELLPTPLWDAHSMSRPKEKCQHKGEMHFNFSLSISV
jgi:hypothetical protein